MINKLISAQDVAEALGCSVASVWRYAKAGTIPSPVKLGALTRWRKAELDAFITGAAEVAV